MNPPYRTWTEIDLDTLAANYHALARAAGPGVIAAPVVKADAYRHGALDVSRRLEREGATWLCVSSAAEGAALRQAGLRARILVMGGFLPFERATLVENGLTPVVHSLAQLEDYDQWAAASGRRLPVHFKVDSGMGRLGSRAAPADIAASILRCHHLEVEGLTTHLASASDFSSPQTTAQVALFEQTRGALKASGIVPPLVHVASSDPVVYGLRSALGTMVRPGLSLYGYANAPMGDAPPLAAEVRPVMRWLARILELKDLPEGATVGYGARYRASRPTRVAVLAAGYADGYPQILTTRPGAWVSGPAGERIPVIGAVSMDLLTLDVTDCPHLAPGDALTLFGPEGPTAADLADWATTIPYAILCALGPRVARIAA
jgi:alanine racemase